MRWVVDASVAAKWLAPEPDSVAAEAMLDHELIVPDLLFAEVANILWKKQMRGEMDAAAARVGARWLLQVPLQVHNSAQLMVEALSVAIQLQHPAYDGFYLALALRVDAPLVTADRRLVERCRRADAAKWQAHVRSLEAGGV
jgi:predicted nucleic acid-binding protein